MSKVQKVLPEWLQKAVADVKADFADTADLIETARRRRARLGLKLIWIKEMGKADGSIPHGEFQPFLKREFPGTPLSTVGDYITEAKSVLELLRWQISEIRRFETPPHKLLITDSSDLKGVEKDRQAKLNKIIEQQSHFRAVTQYKQVELKDDATVPRAGRRKGEGGASREQRAAHRMKLAQAELAEQKILLRQLGNFLDDTANETVLRKPELREEFLDLFPKAENWFRLLQRVKQAIK